VDAASGIVLYDPEQPTDSKVIIKSDAVALSSKRFSEAIKGRLVRGQSTIANKDANNKALKKLFDRKRNEERAFERAISVSSEEVKKEKEEEDKIIKRAMSLSILDSKAELDEDDTLKQAMAMSQHEFERENEAEALFLEAIELSRTECHRHEIEEDDELLRALEQSVLDF
jgi:hypothetical protein